MLSRSRAPLIAAALLLPLIPTTFGSAAATADALVVQNGRIAFTTGGAHSQLYTINPDGTDERQLTHESDGNQVDSPDWSPDGSQIAYVSNASGFFDVVAMNADGTDQHVLAHSDGWDYYEPRWSPDGTQFVVVRCNSEIFPDLYCDLDLMKADGTGRHILVGSHVINIDPTWSPDGSQIAFASNRAGLVDAVWVVNASGGGLDRLTRPAVEGFYPSWSPLGNHLLLSNNSERPHQHTLVMSPDGTRARRFSPEPPNNTAFFASYSPDGRHVVIVSDLLPGYGLDLFTMNANGTNLTPIMTGHPNVFLSDWGTFPSTDAPTR